MRCWLSHRPDIEHKLDTISSSVHSIEDVAKKLAKRMEDAMALIDDVTARVGALEDGVKALLVHVDTLKAAFDDLKAHPVVVENPALQGIADRIGAVTDAMGAEAAKIGASGGV